MKPKKYPYRGKAKLIRKELPRFFNHEEKVVMVHLNIDKVVETLNQYK